MGITEREDRYAAGEGFRDAIFSAQAEMLRTGNVTLAARPLLSALASWAMSQSAALLWPSGDGKYEVVGTAGVERPPGPPASLEALLASLFPGTADGEVSRLPAGRGLVACLGHTAAPGLEPLLETCSLLMESAPRVALTPLLQTVLNSTVDGIALATGDRRLLYTNRRFVEIWNLSPDAVTASHSMGLRPLLLSLLLDEEGAASRVDQIYADPLGESRDVAELKDGRILEILTRPCRLADGTEARLWMFRDVTESQRALRAYQLAKERLEIGTANRADNFYDWNILTGEVYYSGTDAVRPVTEFAAYVHPEDRERSAEALRRHFELGEPYDVEYRTKAQQLIGLEGYGWVRARGTAIRDADGRPVRMVGWSTNVTERRQIQQALEESEARYRRILAQVKEVIFQVDARLNWAFLSPAWQQCTGHAVEPCTGRQFLEYVHADDRKLMEDYLQRISIRPDERPDGIEVRWTTASGRPRWLRCNMSVERAPDGEIASFSGTILDVHERREAERERERAQLARSEFLATVSHEIRTPLNGIIGACDLLARTVLTTDQSEYLRVARTSSGHLIHLIDDLLDISKIEAGQLDVVSVRFEPIDLLDEVCNNFRTVMSERGLDFDLYVETPLPAVTGDPHRIRQILSNLLANAAKFTPSGSVSISASATRPEGGQCRLRFEVSDTGPGIPLDKQTLIFEKFVQLQTGTTRRESGAGLGLAISKLLAHKMGGQLSVQSAPGSGSTFVLDITLGASSEAATEAGADGKTVYLCLGDDRLSGSMAVLLESVGAKVISGARLADAAGGAGSPARCVVTDALTLAEQGSGALSRLAGRGIECVVAVRHNEAFLPPSSGAKLIERPVLPSGMRALAGGRELPGAAVSVSLPPEARTVAVKPRILLVEDKEDNAFLLQTLLRHAGYDADTVASGADAVARATAFAYDLVFMDVEMPEMDGLEATKRIRLHETEHGRRRTPIVALTAHALESYRERCLAAGMDDFLAKPVRASECEEKARKWIDMRPVILAIAPGAVRAGWVRELTGDERAVMVTARTVRAAVEVLLQRRINCVLLPVARLRDPEQAVGTIRSASESTAVIAVTSSESGAREPRWVQMGFSRAVSTEGGLKLEQLGLASNASTASGHFSRSTEELHLPPRVAALLPRYLSNRAAEVGALSEALERNDMEFIRRTGHNLKGSGGGYGLAQLSEIGRALESGAAANDHEAIQAAVVRLRAVLAELGVECPPRHP